MFKWVAFLMVVLAGASGCAVASPIRYGPLLIGSDAPIGDGAIVADGVFQADLPGLHVYQTGDYQSSTIETFTFDIDPGFEITRISLPLYTDNTDEMPPFAYTYRQALTLCSGADVCQSGQYSETYEEGLTVPPFGPLAIAGAGTGIYQLDVHTINQQLSNPDLDEVTIDFAPVAPVPEPGTFALLGTGVAGVAGMLRRRWLPRS